MFIEEIFEEMTKKIDEFGKFVEDTGLQWHSPEQDMKVREVYGMCHHLVNELKELTDQAKQRWIDAEQMKLKLNKDD
jgi:hypothetical protein